MSQLIVEPQCRLVKPSQLIALTGPACARTTYEVKNEYLTIDTTLRFSFAGERFVLIAKTKDSFNAIDMIIEFLNAKGISVMENVTIEFKISKFKCSHRVRLYPVVD